MEPRYQKPLVKTLTLALMSQRRVSMGYSRLFNTSWVDYEYDEWFRITSFLYYHDDILYYVVRRTSPDTEVWISLIPSRNSRIKFMFDQ